MHYAQSREFVHDLKQGYGKGKMNTSFNHTRVHEA
jgi:hypothetical protein